MLLKSVNKAFLNKLMMFQMNRLINFWLRKRKEKRKSEKYYLLFFKKLENYLILYVLY